MNTLHPAALTLLWLVASVHPSTAQSKLQIIDVGPNDRVWSLKEDATQLISGTSNGSDPQRGRVVEIATGMNYWNGEEWVDSDPTFDLTDTAFVATRVQHKIQLAPNLNMPGAVTVTTLDGIILQSTPVGIGLYDAASGESLIIASVQDSAGVLVSSNQVLYENAFKGVCVDVLYTLERGSFEQDVVITGRLNPADWGFPPESTRIQIFTEFYQSTEPERIRRPVRVEKDLDVRQRMASPDLVDEVLGFGEFVLATGRAFFHGGGMRNSGAPAAPVAKEFKTIAERTMLIESVEFNLIQADLTSLPECAQQAGLVKKKPALVKKIRNSKKASPTFAAIPRAVFEKQAKVAPKPTKLLMAHNTSKRPGVVIDYIATIGPGLSVPTVFQGDTTYLVTGAVICNGATTIEGGAVFKFKYLNPATGSIKILNTLTCKSSSYRPAIFTAVDDNSVGDSMNPATNPNAPPTSQSGYTGVINAAGYANPALWINNSGGQKMNNLRFSFCQEAVRVEASVGSTLWHSQLVNCIRGIVITGCSSGCGTGAAITVNNALFAGVKYPITLNNQSANSAHFYYSTIDGGPSSTLVSSVGGFYSSANFYNSVIANVTTRVSSFYVSVYGDHNGFYNSANAYFGTFQYIATTSPFQSVASGNYYLASDSNFRNVGTTTGLPTPLLTDLKGRTTDPPLIWVSAITMDTTCYRGLRDNDASPNIGYHYDGLDYVLDNVTLSAKLTLANGVAVGLRNNFGLSLQTGAGVASEGKPTRMNALASIANVQEQPISMGGSTVMQLGSGSAAIALDFRFTDISAGQGKSGVILDAGGSSSYPFSRLSFQDCWVRNATLTLYPASTSPVTIAFTNNIIERCVVNVGRILSSTTPLSICFYNNLFRGNPNSSTPGTPPALTLVCNGSSTPNWEVDDNLFDAASQTLTGNNTNQVTPSINGFTGATVNSLGGSNILNLSSNFLTGPLGTYYYPATGAAPSLAALINAGSRTAAAAGLYHYTVKSAVNTKEGTDTPATVDIGFHYIGVNASNQPLDYDADGLPDYFEDRNGNGSGSDTGETDWQTYNSQNGLTSNPGLQLFTPLK